MLDTDGRCATGAGGGGGRVDAGMDRVGTGAALVLVTVLVDVVRAVDRDVGAPR